MTEQAHWLDVLTPEQERAFWRDLRSTQSESLDTEECSC